MFFFEKSLKDHEYNLWLQHDSIPRFWFGWFGPKFCFYSRYFCQSIFSSVKYHIFCSSELLIECTTFNFRTSLFCVTPNFSKSSSAQALLLELKDLCPWMVTRTCQALHIHFLSFPVSWIGRPSLLAGFLDSWEASAFARWSIRHMQTHSLEQIWTDYLEAIIGRFCPRQLKTNEDLMTGPTRRNLTVRCEW